MRVMRMLSLTLLVVAALSASGQSTSETLAEEVVRLRAEVASLRAAHLRAATNAGAVTERGSMSPSDLNGCADSSSREPVNVEDLRAEMKLSLSVREREKQEQPAQRLRVETWCGTWFDCCYFSHVGPATGLVEDCYSVIVRHPY